MSKSITYGWKGIERLSRHRVESMSPQGWQPGHYLPKLPACWWHHSGPCMLCPWNANKGDSCTEHWRTLWGVGLGPGLLPLHHPTEQVVMATLAPTMFCLLLAVPNFSSGPHNHSIGAERKTGVLSPGLLPIPRRLTYPNSFLFFLAVCFQRIQ